MQHKADYEQLQDDFQSTMYHNGLILVVHVWKSYIQGNKFQIWGVLTSKIYRNIVRTPEMYILPRNDAFWAVFSSDRTRHDV